MLGLPECLLRMATSIYAAIEGPVSLGVMQACKHIAPASCTTVQPFFTMPAGLEVMSDMPGWCQQRAVEA